MAPVQTAVLNAVPAVSNPQTADALHLERRLAHKAAKSLKQPHKTPAQIVEDLLARLLEVKRRREHKGLNHWEEFAPAYLHQLVDRHESLRRRAVEDYFRSERLRALARAEVILGDRCEAEDAVSDAYIRVLAGKTGPSHFYRILSHVCIWRKRARASAAKLVTRERNPQFEGDDNASPEAACTILSQGDPLDILIREEEFRTGMEEVKTNRKYRGARDRAWWKELLEFAECGQAVPERAG